VTARITRQELEARLAVPPAPTIIEALGAAYWADAHLPGAVNIPTSQVDRLAPRLLLDLDADIIVYSSGTCEGAQTVARRLIDLGYRRVRVYEGGKEEWIEHGLAVERSTDIT
jgi:rhodanese-related sulfurtransferase